MQHNPRAPDRGSWLAARPTNATVTFQLKAATSSRPRDRASAAGHGSPGPFPARPAAARPLA